MKLSPLFLLAAMLIALVPLLAPGQSIDEQLFADPAASPTASVIDSVIGPPADGTPDPSILPIGYEHYGSDYASGGGVDYSARVRTGLGYFQDDFDSRVTANYGLDLAMPITDQWGGYGSVTYGHFSEGTQYFGSVGFYRQGVDNGGLTDRISGGVLFDQLVDTRFDDLYVSQLRYFLGAALTDNVAAGVTYTDPAETDTASVATGGGPTPLAFQSAEVIEAYVSAWFGSNLVTATVGHRDDPSDAVAGLLVRRYLSRTAVAYFGFQSASSELWSGTAGFECQFGPGTRFGRRRHGRSSLLAANHSSASDTIVRGQSGGSCVGNPFADPSLGGNLSYGPNQFVSRLSTSATTGGGGMLVPDGGVVDPPTDVGLQGQGGSGELGGGGEEEVVGTGGGLIDPGIDTNTVEPVINPLIRGIF